MAIKLCMTVQTEKVVITPVVITCAITIGQALSMPKYYGFGTDSYYGFDGTEYYGFYEMEYTV